MKKLIAIILVLVMALSFAACGGEKGENTPTAQPQAENTPEVGGASENVSNVSGEVGEGKTITVVDNEECVITITGVEDRDELSYIVNAELENKSTEKTYTFSVAKAAINGVVSDPFFSTDVAPGAKISGEIEFFKYELTEKGVGEFTDIEMTFRVFDSEDYFSDPVAEQAVNVYPLGADKVVHYTREAQATDTVMVDNEYATAIVTGYENDEMYGYAVNFYLVNKTDKDLLFYLENVTVNGAETEPYYAATVHAGKCAFSPLTWFAGEIDPSNVAEIKFDIAASDDSDLFSEDFFREAITLNP